MSLNPETRRKISRSIDEVLETLGKSGKQALTKYLETTIGLKKKEIPQKPELFRKGLNLIFGDQAADLLETEIVEKLLTSLEIDPKSKLTLAEAIGLIRAAQEKPC
jgi:hypothetical protein